MTSTEEKALKNFLLDIKCLQSLNKWKEDFNLFSVLKISNMEIRHSNILAWLLDPNENHGLGDAFIRAFMTRIVAHYNPGKVNAFNVLLQDYYSYQVLRESNRMDIVLYSHDEKTAVIIENKIWAGESPTQLKTYLDKSKIEYKDCNQLLYVFLSPEGRNSSDPDTWVSLSYAEVVDSLNEAQKGIQIKPEAQLLIKNYIEIVRREIMKERDEDLERVCNEIFNKHRVALGLIFENVNIDSSLESAIILEELHKLHDEGKIIVIDKKNNWAFLTSAMNAYLPELNQPNGSWGSTFIYWYWFEIKELKNGRYLSLHLELGGWGISEDIKEREKTLAKAAGKNKFEINRYGRIKEWKEKLSQDDYQASIKGAVNNLVVQALADEKELLEKTKASLVKSNNKNNETVIKKENAERGSEEK